MTPQLSGRVTDALGDATGPHGNYIIPQHAVSAQQRDIEVLSFEQSGDILELSLTMAELTDTWVPFNGFDNLALSIFFSDGGERGVSTCPNYTPIMQIPATWQVAHVGSGWASCVARGERRPIGRVSALVIRPNFSG